MCSRRPGTLAAQFAAVAGARRIVGVVGSAALALALLADGSARIDITAEHRLPEVAATIAGLATGATRGKSIIRIQ